MEPATKRERHTERKKTVGAEQLDMGVIPGYSWWVLTERLRATSVRTPLISSGSLMIIASSLILTTAQPATLHSREHLEIVHDNTHTRTQTHTQTYRH
ncbi:unnamed protein product [Arctogadus glacialis]